MEEWYGYAGKILRVDLSRGKTASEPLDREIARNYLGGTGYAAKLMGRILSRRITCLSSRRAP